MSLQIVKASIDEQGGTYNVRDTEANVTYHFVDADNRALQGEADGIEEGRKFFSIGGAKNLPNKDEAKVFLEQALQDRFIQNALAAAIDGKQNSKEFSESGRCFGSFEIRDLPHSNGTGKYYGLKPDGKVDTASFSIQDFSKKPWFGEVLQVTISGGDSDQFIAGMLTEAGANEMLGNKRLCWF